MLRGGDGDPDSLDVVTTVDPERGAAAETAPLARISHRALRSNFPQREAFDAVADLRADAWGHGAAAVGRTLRQAGVGAFLVDAATRDAFIAVGADPRRLRTTGEATIDSDRLYGLPGSGGIPVLRLSGTVLSTKALRAGEGVSYGYLHRAAADTRVALVTGGYAQGIVRALGGRVRVVIRGERHPIVGRVAMDVCVVEIGGSPVARGDEVVFVGDPGRGEPSLAEWTSATGLTAGELVAAIGRGARREHVR